MSVDAIKIFYEHTLNNESVQSQLIKTNGTDEFINLSVKLGGELGHAFSEEEMRSTMSGLAESKASSDLDFGSKWINKVMEVGWVPLGYSK
jgi:hypothetical protein